MQHSQAIALLAATVIQNHAINLLSSLSLSTQTHTCTVTKETAFTYALTSATMVHVITKACSDGRLKNCSCDTRLQGQVSPQGWQWGGCSDDVGFGIMFTRAFLDSRNDATNKTGSELEESLVNLHNNAVGRTVRQYCTHTFCIVLLVDITCS